MAAAAVAQFLPVGLFRNQPRALRLDHVSRVRHVLAQLRIAQHRQRRLGKRRRHARDPEPDAGMRSVDSWRAPPSRRCFGAGQNLAPCGSSSSPQTAGASRPQGASGNCCPAPCRYSARVASTSCILAASIAEETSPFFTENVPPNPQQRSRFASGTSSIPRTLASSRNGRSPSCRRAAHGSSRDRSRGAENTHPHPPCPACQ